jgi:hypothetical protein
MICPSRHLAGLMRDAGARDVRHLNYFIDPIAGGAPVPRKPRELVFIGRLEPEKGVEYLLEAMPLIRAADPEVRLTIVGGGSLASVLASRAEGLRLENTVTFLSHVPRTELGRFYATATACVLPSIWSENSPLVAYECLAAGMPMIASRIGGIPELVEDGEAGFTFTPRDSRDLAAKALRLLALPQSELTRMSSAMRARAEDFRMPVHLDRICELYAEVLGRRRSRATPAVPIDLDLLTILGHFGEEKGRLGTYFCEHVAHIARLEEALAARGASPSPAGASRESSLARAPEDRLRPGAPQEDPSEILLRLGRAIRKVLKG